MKTTELHYCVALTLLAGIGHRSAKTLVAHYGDPEDFFNDKKLHLRNIPGFTRGRLKAINRTEALLQAEKHVSFIQRHKIDVLFYANKNYPQRLKSCVDAPILLYKKGNFETNPMRTIAIVGTRNITDYGREIVEHMVSAMKPMGVQVVSGMAYGVDILAHRLSVLNGMSTVGVLGHGLDRLYPSFHKKVAEMMIASEGGLLTEFLDGTRPDRENFPMRNRIVAGMTDATVVIESGIKGGSLITANLANDYNRDVFAFPGNINNMFSAGCNQLIYNNKAHLVRGAEDIIDVLGWKHQAAVSIQHQLFPEFSSEEQLVVNTLKEKTICSVDELASSLAKPISKLNSCLINLELSGVVSVLPGNKFKLV